MRFLKRISTILMLLMLTICAPMAIAYQYNDNTPVHAFHNIYPTGVWTDIIGYPSIFDTHGANLSGNLFTIYTNWNPNHNGYLGAYTADLFINDNETGTNWAIRMDTFNGSGDYFIFKNPTYGTSQDEFGSSGLLYGGEYNLNSPSSVPVWATSGFTGGATPGIWTYGIDGLNNQIQVDLSSLRLSNNWSFVWGTATCSNDAFAGNVSTSVPEPTTMLLLGVSLVGFGILKKKVIN